MKKRSKLFLLVSAGLVVLGIIVCLVGAGIAKGGGEMLFPSDIGDGKGYTYEIGDSSVDKVKISVTDADVNIIGGAEKTKIEIINFNENRYSFSGDTPIITFRETEDFSTMFSFWNGGFSFKGLRYFFKLSSPDGRKTVNVYVDDTKNVKMFEISAESGKISVSGFSTDTDYDISTGSGNIVMKNITTNSTLRINASDTPVTNITFDKITAGTIEVEAKKAEVKAVDISAESCDISVDTGGVSVAPYTPTGDKYDVFVSTPGKLSVNGEKYIDSFVYECEKEEPEKGGEAEIVPHISVSARDASVTLEIPSLPGQMPDGDENENNG